MNAYTLSSWSGGKDSCFALMKAIDEGYTPKVLLNVLNEEGKISRSHGIPSLILQAQSEAASIPIHMISSSWKDYEEKFVTALKDLTAQYALDNAVFGDIDLASHREWEENVCRKAGIEAHLPLWHQNRRELVTMMINAGIEAIIVSCNETMGQKFLGRLINEETVKELEDLGVDACGENGEYHTLVVNCPIFSKRVNVEIMQNTLHEGYWFCTLGLKDLNGL